MPVNPMAQLEKDNIDRPAGCPGGRFLQVVGEGIEGLARTGVWVGPLIFLAGILVIPAIGRSFGWKPEEVQSISGKTVWAGVTIFFVSLIVLFALPRL